jgi:hypothetical protein
LAALVTGTIGQTESHKQRPYIFVFPPSVEKMGKIGYKISKKEKNKQTNKKKEVQYSIVGM